MEEFQRATEMQPDNWYSHFTLGTTFLRQNQFGPARDALEKAAKIAPDKPPIQQALAAAHAGMGDHEAASAIYDQALELDPRNPRAIVGAALARSAQGKHNDALELLRGVGRMGARFPPIQKALGDVYVAAGRHQDAVDAFRAMILNSPRMADNAPDLVKMANRDEVKDAEAFAKELQEALGKHVGAASDRVRANPQQLREQLLARRGGQRNAG